MSENPYAAPISSVGSVPARESQGRTISRVYPMQAGKISAFTYGVLGAIFSPFLLLGAIFGEGGESLAFGIGFALAFPIFYAVLGFVGGVIGSAVYNFAAGVVGGIKVDID